MPVPEMHAVSHFSRDESCSWRPSKAGEQALDDETIDGLPDARQRITKRTFEPLYCYSFRSIKNST